MARPSKEEKNQFEADKVTLKRVVSGTLNITESRFKRVRYRLERYNAKYGSN